MVHIEDILLLAISQKGTKYVFGAETTPGVPSTKYDCSELVQWSCESAGLQNVPDGAINQYRWLERNGMAHAMTTTNLHQRGWLAFPYPNVHHVVFLLGDGTTMEAKGAAYGVGTFSAAGRFQRCGPIPGVDYSPRNRLASPQEVAAVPGPKEVTDAKISGDGVLMLQADGGIVSTGKPKFFGSLFNLPAAKRLMSPGEYCRWLEVYPDHLVIITSQGDRYDSKSWGNGA